MLAVTLDIQGEDVAKVSDPRSPLWSAKIFDIQAARAMMPT
jgi:hypothetical protein